MESNIGDFIKEQAKELGLGATGEYPLGKTWDDDAGELKVAVGDLEGKVIINFGKPTAWIGMLPDEADAFAAVLKEKATRARSNKK